MNHEVKNVQLLHEDANGLYKNVIIGSSSHSADTIISNLASSVEILKNDWKGKDACIQIENIIKVHNAMIEIRKMLVTLAVLTSKIAADYRDIQNANGAGLDTLSALSADSKSLLQDYTDNTDTVNIVSEANEGKIKIDAANNAIDDFISESKKYYNSIMQNWTSGPQREEIITGFETLLSNINNYKNTLNAVSQSIRTAISNYGF